jgi:ABC-type polysaccharide/polyol phosphate transport system ATPase subunit
MSPRGTIEAQSLWKRFRTDRRRMLLRDEFERVWGRIRGNGDYGWRWALRDVNFSAAPGDSLGLVGTNGSGKTTLLKILTQVMYPYAGRLEVAGRVGALIEVRAGIHPDLSGRENVYVTGSLLGLRRRQVARRFDEIVAFAELEDAIDRQVKFYSSGMQMRLGFAVAAFLEPDILLVDEALAVGDASFQQKCLERMRSVIASGTTLVFVSHDLAAVEATCRRGLWIRQGVLEADGPVRDVLASYRESIEEAAEANVNVEGVVRLVKTEIGGPGGEGPRTNGPLDLRFILESSESRVCDLFVGVTEGTAAPVFVLRRHVDLRPGETELRCSVSSLPLPRGRYYVWVGVMFADRRDLLPWHPATHFDVAGPELDPAPLGIARSAPVHVDTSWEVSDR